MRILALEFSTTLRSAALVDEGRVVCQTLEKTPQSSGPNAMIQDALDQAAWEPGQIECVAVGVGPGSYTGIRVAIATAQGWELAQGTRLLGVSSAECLAWRAWLQGIQGEFAVVIDAQRGEFYAERYRVDAFGVKPTSPLAIRSPNTLAGWAKEDVVLVGVDLPQTSFDVRPLRPEAGMVGVLAWGRTEYVSGAELQPIYLRKAQFVKAPPARTIPPVVPKEGGPKA